LTEQSIIDNRFYGVNIVKFKPADIVRESLADRVRQVLMERIIDGTYPPGTRLVEMQIARELKISQAPVREAFRVLEAARLVETEPYRGTRVRQVSDRECREAYQVRAVLEELAAQLGGAQLREQSRELRTEADATLAAAKRGEVVRYLHHNVRFHQAIVEAADNTVLRNTWESLSFTVGARVKASRASGDMVAVAREHRQIVDAIVHGDAKTAGRLLRRHAEVLIEDSTCGGKERPSSAAVFSASRPLEKKTWRSANL
jgi:DNA-binding GntR family transcriptional regulator